MVSGVGREVPTKAVSERTDYAIRAQTGMDRTVTQAGLARVSVIRVAFVEGLAKQAVKLLGEGRIRLALLQAVFARSRPTNLGFGLAESS